MTVDATEVPYPVAEALRPFAVDLAAARALIRYCACGCGQHTSVAKRNSKRLGHVKGQPVKYVCGHGAWPYREPYVEQDTGHATPCWIWQRAKMNKGYGWMHVKGRNVLAHRHYYERHRAHIPEGLELDHLCRVPACVRPDHLEPVTHAENMRRRSNAYLAAWEAAR